MRLNLHHLELFYHVAKAGGISRACTMIPYGIQQPAVSSQLLKLEKDIGLPLFTRKPFQLTPAGERLRAEIAPFFDRMEGLCALVQGEVSQQLRVVAVGEVLKKHIPGLLHPLRKKFPRLKVKLYERNQGDAMRMVEQGEADLAVTVREVSLSSGFSSRDLIRLPMVLLVPKAMTKIKRAEDLWTQKLELPLVALPTHEILTRQFMADLKGRGLVWPVALEASSIELVADCVAQGMGVGLSVKLPKSKVPEGLRVLPLPGFSEIIVAAGWRGELSEPSKIFLGLLTDRAKDIVLKMDQKRSTTRP